MGHIKDEAIVLSRLSYSESDRIVRLLTLKEGKISAIAKGGNKSQKRFMNTLEPFNILRVEYFEKEGKDLVRIENADIIETNYGIERNLHAFATASFFTEFVDKLLKERERNPEIFHILEEIIKRIKKENFSFHEITLFKLKILKASGYLPNFETCVHCGRRVEKKSYFSKEKGGILCKDCSRFLPHRIYEEKLIEALSALTKLNLSDLEGLEEEAEQLLEGFIDFHLNLSLKSSSILKELTVI